MRLALYNKHQDKLETDYIDHSDIGLDGILEMIANICHEKAEHLRSNWQDESSAQLWERTGNMLDHFYATMPIKCSTELEKRF